MGQRNHKRKQKIYFEMRGNESATCQNLSGAAKAGPRGKLIAINVNILKRSQVSILTFHLMRLEKEEQSQPEASKREEIINVNTKINELEKSKAIEKSNETKSWFLEISTKLIKP